MRPYKHQPRQLRRDFYGPMDENLVHHFCFTLQLAALDGLRLTAHGVRREDAAYRDVLLGTPYLFKHWLLRLFN